MNVLCHGARAARLCIYLCTLSSPNTMITELRLGEPNDTVRFDALNGLCEAFKKGVLPKLVTFHIEIHTDTGEQGIFTLIEVRRGERTARERR